MPYKEKLERELEPELFLAVNLLGIENIRGIGVKKRIAKSPARYSYLPTLEYYDFRDVLIAVKILYDTHQDFLNYLKGIDFKEKLKQAISELPERQKSIIILRYGLEDGVVYTRKEVSHGQVTAEMIRQIEAKAIRRLSHTPLFSELQRIFGTFGA